MRRGKSVTAGALQRAFEHVWDAQEGAGGAGRAAPGGGGTAIPSRRATSVPLAGNRPQAVYHALLFRTHIDEAAAKKRLQHGCLPRSSRAGASAAPDVWPPLSRHLCAPLHVVMGWIQLADRLGVIKSGAVNSEQSTASRQSDRDRESTRGWGQRLEQKLEAAALGPVGAAAPLRAASASQGGASMHDARLRSLSRRSLGSCRGWRAPPPRAPCSQSLGAAAAGPGSDRSRSHPGGRRQGNRPRPGWGSPLLHGAGRPVSSMTSCSPPKTSAPCASRSLEHVPRVAAAAALPVPAAAAPPLVAITAAAVARPAAAAPRPLLPLLPPPVAVPLLPPPLDVPVVPPPVVVVSPARDAGGFGQRDLGEGC